MKALIKLACVATLLTTAIVGRADSVSGYFRSNGTYIAPHYRSFYGSLGGNSGYSSSSSTYVFRNPYAAYPSVSVNSYYRSTGTHVTPHVRTSPNSTLTDNLSYRGFGTILSACDTGTGEVKIGEGVMSLRRAFLH